MKPRQVIIRVVGVGGAGSRIVEHLADRGFSHGDLIAIDTDAPAQMKLRVPNRLVIGRTLDERAGAHGSVAVGATAARESEAEVRRIIGSADMVFVIAGLGGGTGSGAAPLVADLASTQGALVLALVSQPSDFEGSRKRSVAEEALPALAIRVDSFAIVPYDRLVGEQTSFEQLLRQGDAVMSQAIEDIAGLVAGHGFPGVGFATLRALLSRSGRMLLGIGEAAGQNRSRDAAVAVLSGSLLDPQDLARAAGVLVVVTGNENLRVAEVEAIEQTVASKIGANTGLIVGSMVDPNMRAKVRVTIIATGLRA